jgi:hypothetical protein
MPHPKHLVDLYQQRKNNNKGRHESYFTTETKAQPERHDSAPVDPNGGDVQMDESEDDLLRSDFDLFGDMQ